MARLKMFVSFDYETDFRLKGNLVARTERPDSPFSVAELTLCGTALRGDAAPENGADFLARFDPDSKHTLIDLGEMEEELGALLGRETLIGSWDAIERSDNPYRRASAREAAQTVYGAA